MYIVVMFESYVGEFFHDASKVFFEKEQAQKYCDKLNKDFANINNCAVEDLGDYFVIEEIEIG